MVYRHTLSLLLLLLALSSTLAHSRAHKRPSKRNSAVATVNSTSLTDFSESPGGQCPRGRGPLPLSELNTMLERHAPLPMTPTWALTCLSAPHCATEGDPCAPEGLCAPAGPDVRLRRARQLRLKNCPHLTLFSVMSLPQREALDSANNCCKLARHLKERDDTVHKFLRVYQVLLRRSNFLNDCRLGGPWTSWNECGPTPPGGCITCEVRLIPLICHNIFPHITFCITITPKQSILTT